MNTSHSKALSRKVKQLEHHQYKGFLDRNGIDSRADINVFGKSLAELIRTKIKPTTKIKQKRNMVIHDNSGSMWQK